MSFGAPFPGGPTPIVVTYESQASGNVAPLSQTVWTFAGLAFGPAFAKRQIIVWVTALAGTAPAATVTIGGVAATQIGPWSTTGSLSSIALYAAAVPTGTTGTVVVTFTSFAVANIAVLVYQASRPFSAAVTVLNGVQPFSTTLNVPSYGAVIAGENITSQNSTPSAAWSGLTKDTDFTYGAFNRWGTSTASLNFTYGNPALAASATITGGTLNTGAALFAVLT